MNKINKTGTNQLAKTLLALGMLTSSVAAYAENGYQHSVLFSPSPSILQAEAKGRIMIYDSLENETVEMAMNEQFDRIENMMFVRTQYIQEDGEYEVEDDCD